MKIHKNKRKENNKITTNKPNNSLSTFVNDKSFDLDVFYMMEYLSTDLKSEILLYRINQTMNRNNNIYGESKVTNKSYEAPISLSAIVDISDSELTNYFDTGIAREDMGKMVCTLFDQELDSKGVKINRGDIIGYSLKSKMRYFEVVDANYVNESTTQTNGYYKAFHRNITAIPVKEDIFLNNKI